MGRRDSFTVTEIGPCVKALIPQPPARPCRFCGRRVDGASPPAHDRPHAPRHAGCGVVRDRGLL